MKPHQKNFTLRHGSDESVSSILENPSKHILELFPHMTTSSTGGYSSSRTDYKDHPVLRRENVVIPPSFYKAFGKEHSRSSGNLKWLANHPKTPKDFLASISSHKEQPEERISQNEIDLNFKKLKEGRAGKNGHHFLSNPSVSDYKIEEYLDHPTAKKYVGYIGKHRKFMPVSLQEKIFKIDPSALVENEHLHPVAQNAIVHVVASHPGDTSKFEGIFRRKDLSKNNVDRFIASGRHAFKMAARPDLTHHQQESVLRAKSEKGLDPSKGFVFSNSVHPEVMENVRTKQWVMNPKDSNEHAFALGFWNKLESMRPLDAQEEKKKKTSETLADNSTFAKIKSGNSKGFK